MTTTTRLLRWALLLCAAVLLSACAYGRKIAYNTTVPDIEPQGTLSVAVGTSDQRPYIVSGDKTPTFVGLMRGGYGNPFNVNTVSGAPLADDINASLSSALSARGFTASSVSIASSDSTRAAKEKLVAKGAERSVFVVLNEWKSDTFMNTSLLFDVVIRVFDGGGNELGSADFKGNDNIGRGVILDAYKRKMESWFSDPRIVKALQ